MSQMLKVVAPPRSVVAASFAMARVAVVTPPLLERV